METGGQQGIFDGMGQDVVGHVDEVGFGTAEKLGETDGFLDGLMGRMVSMAQGVEYEGINALQVGHLGIGDGLHVGDVGEVLDAEAEDGQVAVHDADGDDFDILANMDGLVGLNATEVDGGHTGITFLGRREAIGNALFKMVGTIGFCIDIDVTEDTVGTEVVEPADVVVVFVGDKHGVEGLEIGVEHLLTEVRPTIYEDALAANLHEGGATQAFVAWVGGGAGGTGATDLRNAAGSTGAEEDDSHIKLTSG